MTEIAGAMRHTNRRPSRSTWSRSLSADVAVYAAGLVIGFLLAALASVPGGGGVVGWQLAGAGVSAAVCLVAARRARTRRPRARATRTTVTRPIDDPTSAAPPMELRRAA
ncbi:MAG: hypothetical protein U0Y82_07955 [Thermoleophilia bacterium]